MKFTRYNSIDNAGRTKTTNYYVEHGLSHGDWVCTEKVHGSNFAVYVSDNEIKLAKRSGFIGLDANFFGSYRVVSALQIQISRLWDLVRAEVNNSKERITLEHMSIHGELYGGWYPHNDVEKVKNAVKVQKHVYYHPDNQFYPFDIKINGQFVDHDTFERLIEAAGFGVYGKALFRGTLQECVDYRNDFQSTIPAQFGLPALEDNMVEGIVIKPVEPRFMACGSRVILKSKNSRFSEKTSNHGKRIRVKEMAKLSDVGKELLTQAFDYVTENRLRNVLSKFGSPNEKQFGQLMGLMTQDSLEDFGKDHDLSELTKKEKRLLNKSVGRRSAELIRAQWLNILDGSF